MPVAGILNDLKKLKHPKPVYLVGGIVRDLLLEHQTKDIDLVCLKAKTLAVKFGKSSGGSFFPLDEDNEIYRVVLKNNYLVDFAELRGKSIEEDLSLRDFTVDAMAVKLVDGSSLAVSGKDIIDPFCGQEDLRRQVIKMVGTKIFKDDPLRLLRAFRLSACQRFRIDKNTINLLSRQARLIKKVAPERIREELIKILACSDSHIYLEQMDKAGLIEILIPEVKPMKTTARDFYGPNGVWSHTLSGLRYMEEILPQIKKYFPRHADEIIEHLDEKITGEVRRWVILKMAYLLHDFGKPGTHTREGKRSRFYGHELAGVKLAEKILARLHFSKKEIRVITNIIANHMRPGNLSDNPSVTVNPQSYLSLFPRPSGRGAGHLYPITGRRVHDRSHSHQKEKTKYLSCRFR